MKRRRDRSYKENSEISYKMKSGLNLNEKGCEKHFVDKSRDKKFVHPPRDLRERLNRIRAEKANKIVSHHVAKGELGSDSGFETSVDEIRKVEKPKKRPESRISLPDAIKRALGWQPRPRRASLIPVEKDVTIQAYNSVIPIALDTSDPKADELDQNILNPKIKHYEVAADVKSSVLLKSFMLRADVSPFIPNLPKTSSQHIAIEPSKLQNRLTRIRDAPSPDCDSLTPIIVKPAIPDNKIFKQNVCVETRKSVLVQSDFEVIGRDALLKLTEEQRFSIQYISTVPTKSFKECFDYFVEYNVEIQCIPLDLDAVKTYLKTRGIILEEFSHGELKVPLKNY